MKSGNRMSLMASVYRRHAVAMRMAGSSSLVLAALVAAPSVQAAGNTPDSKPTIVLQRVPVPNTDREMGMGIAEFPPNAAKPRHAATGPELCYVLEGDVTVQIDGQPPTVFHAGETFRLPAGVVHVTRAGPAGAKVVAAWVHTPGQPFNLPGPN